MANSRFSREGVGRCAVVALVCAGSAVLVAQAPSACQCDIRCTGQVIPNTLSYAPTAFDRFLGQDPITPLATVQNELAALKTNVQRLIGIINCNPIGKAVPVVANVHHLACALASNEGPTIFVYGHPYAEMEADVALRNIFFVQTADNNGQPVKAQIQKGAQPSVTTTVEVTGTPQSVISVGGLYCLTVGDSRALETLTPEEVERFHILQPVLKAIIAALKVLGIEVPEDLANKIISTGLELKGTAEYNVTGDLVSTNGGPQHSSGGTVTIVEAKVDETAHVTVDSRAGNPFTIAFVDATDSDKIETVTDVDATATAFAAGRRGEAVSIAGNFWAFFTLMCCQDANGIHRERFVSERLGASYDEELLKRLSKSKVLRRYQSIQDEFKDIFDKDTGNVTTLFATTPPEQFFEACATAKQDLVQMHRKLSKFMRRAEIQLTKAAEK